MNLHYTGVMHISVLFESNNGCLKEIVSLAKNSLNSRIARIPWVQKKQRNTRRSENVKQSLCFFQTYDTFYAYNNALYTLHSAFQPERKTTADAKMAKIAEKQQT